MPLKALRKVSIQQLPVEPEQDPEDEFSGDEEASPSVLSKFAAEQGTRLRRLANQWQTKSRRDLLNLNYDNLEQLHDCFLRSASPATQLVDFEGFFKSLKQTFPPWRRAVDDEVSSAILQHVFEQVDCDADGWVNWQDFSSSVLKQAINIYKNYDGLRDQIFQKPLPDDTYTSPTSCHKEMIHFVKCIPTIGKYITCGRDGSFRIWSSQTRRHLRTVEISKSSPPGWVTCCVDMPGMRTANNPKGVLGVCCMDRTISFYELHQFKRMNKLDLGAVAPLCCDSFSHKNSSKLSTMDQIVIGDVEGKMHLYYVTTALLQPSKSPEPNKGPEVLESLQPYATIHAHTDYVTACRYVKISSKGIIVSTSADSKIGLIDAFDHSIKHYRGHEKAVQCFAFCEEPFSYIVSGGQDRDIQIWNPNTSRKISSLIGHQTCVQGLAYNAKSSHIISLAVDKEVIVWDPRNYSVLCRVRDSMQYRPENTFSAMAWDEKQTALVVANSKFQVWPYAEKWAQSEPPSFVLHKSPIVATLCNVLFECILTMDLTGLALSWSLQDGSQIGKFSCDDGVQVTSAIFDSTHHRLIAGKENGEIKIYNWHDGTVLNELLSESKKEITCILNTPAEESRRYTIATGWDKVVYIWKDPPEKFSQPFLTKVDPGGNTDVLSLQWIPPQTIAAGCYDGSVVIWTTESVWRRKGRIQAITLDKTKSLKFEERDSTAVSCLNMIVPDNNCSPALITAGMDGVIGLWDPIERSKVGEFPTDHIDESAIPQKGGIQPRLPVVCVRSHSGQRLVVTGDSIGQIKGFRTDSDLLGEIFVLRVDVLGASDLVSADANGFSDPYVILSIKEVDQNDEQGDYAVNRTTVQEKTLNPVWNESFSIKLGHGKVSESSKVQRILQCDLFDHDKFGDHDPLGSVSIPIHTLELHKTKESWFKVDTQECSRKTTNSLLHLKLSPCITWNKPELAFAWRAHQDAITNIQFVEWGSSKILSGNLILVTSGIDNCIHLWTMTGEKIATLGLSTWNPGIVDKLIRTGREQRAAKLMNQVKLARTDKTAAPSQFNFASRRRSSVRDLRRLTENKDTPSVREGDVNPTVANPVPDAKAVADSESTTEIINSRTRVTDIPSGTYDVLNQIVLDSLIRRRGRLPEETGLVFTRMHVDGKSEKAYTVKESRVHHWNLGKLKDLGIVQTHRVNYGMVSTDEVYWQDRNSEFPEIIAERPHGTVAAAYGLQQISQKFGKQLKADPHLAAANHPDSIPRSADQTREESRPRTALSALSGIQSRGDTAPTTPTGLPIAHGKADEDDEDDGDQAGGRRNERGVRKAKFNLNLKKVLTLSLPPHRPEGSWSYRKVDIESGLHDGSTRSTPRFDPTKYVSYPGPRPTATPSSSKLGRSFMSGASPLDRSRPLTARSRIETSGAPATEISLALTTAGSTSKPQSARTPSSRTFGASRRFSSRDQNPPPLLELPV